MNCSFPDTVFGAIPDVTIAESAKKNYMDKYEQNNKDVLAEFAKMVDLMSNTFGFTRIENAMVE